MKKTFLLLGAAIILIIFGGLIVKEIGYERVAVGGGTLYGKTEFAGKDAIVIIVAGSGPTDMDGNSVLLTGRNDSLLQLAKALKAKGISTLRYDKRGVGKSAQAIEGAKPDFALFADDCAAFIRHAKAQGFKKVYVAGHSEGSLVAMLAAMQEPVDGVISVAGAGFPIDTALEKQLLPQLGADSPEIAVLNKLREGRIDDTTSADDPLFSPDKQQYLLTWMQHDPAKIIKQLDCAVMVIQGGSDIQVDVSEYNALKEARPDARTLFVEGMNHVLKTVKDEKENMTAYTDPSFEISPLLAEAMAAFVQE